MTRALLQVKAAVKKFGNKNIFEYIRNRQSTNPSNLGIIVEYTRDSLYNGPIDPLSSNLALLTQEISKLDSNIVSIGANVDTAVYRGSFDDLETIKSSSELPVICNDFVVYAYQIFQAKAKGFDLPKFVSIHEYLKLSY